MDMVEKMISGGITQTLIDFANKMLLAGTGVQGGELNDSSNYSDDQVLVYAVAAHQIDVTNNTVVHEANAQTIPIFKYMVIAILFVIVLFILSQEFAPGPAAKITEITHWSATYYQPGDIIEYFLYSAGWYLVVPVLLLAKLELNNFIVSGMVTGVLNQIALSSENAPLYIVMCICYFAMLQFFAIRIVLILYATIMWYFLGLVIAVKPVRWIGIMVFLYISTQIFMQAIVISVVTVVVKLAVGDGLGWIASTLLYSGMTLVIIGISLIIAFWPVLLAIIKPSTLKAIVCFARYAV